jgi:hypothetical protein
MGIILEVIHVTLWQRTCLCFFHALKLCGKDAEFIGDELINPEEISGFLIGYC